MKGESMTHVEKLKSLRERTAQRRVEHVQVLTTSLEEIMNSNPIREKIDRAELTRIAERAADPVVAFKATCKARRLDPEYVVPDAVRKLCAVIDMLPKEDDPDVTYEVQLEAAAMYLQDNPEAWDTYTFLRTVT